jgi:hypothetical protein
VHSALPSLPWDCHCRSEVASHKTMISFARAGTSRWPDSRSGQIGPRVAGDGESSPSRRADGSLLSEETGKGFGGTLVGSLSETDGVNTEESA